MTSNWYTADSVCDSQNFNLRFSEDSTETTDYSLQRFITKKKTEDADDIIVISDSSCSSSPECIDKSKSSSNVKNKEHEKLHFLETSSDSELEKESDSLRNYIRANKKFSKKKSGSKTVIRVNKIPAESSLISNDSSLTCDRLFNTLSTSDALTNDKITVSSSVSYDRNQVNKSKRFFDKSKEHINYKSPILNVGQQVINSKLREKHNTEETNKIIKPSCTVYNHRHNVPSRHPIYNTPKQNNTGKIRLTKKDTYNIMKNIKYTQVVYDSPREKKENHVIIDESTDIDDDAVHPAISSSYNRKIQHPHNSPDVIDSSFKNDILQTNLYKSRIDISRVMDSFRPLSERRLKQIREWLLTNFSDSQSDCSFNTVPPSTRHSGDSGNSSLERLEQNYETPNNRGKINKAQTDEKKTIVSDRVHSFLTRQTTLDQYFKKTKDNSKFCAPDEPKLLPKAQTDKKASSVTNTCTNKDVMDYASILDKLYGTSWRDKAKTLFPTTEPRKTTNPPINRIVQTERKPILKNQHCAVDTDSDKSNLVENNIKTNRRRNIQQKQREMDDFINDESLSSNDSESIYHSAVTNPTIFTSSTTKSTPLPASIKRLQTICDTDTEDEDNKSNSSKNVQRKLSFSDDESSSTSEFDPGDYVPPKLVRNKEIVKRPISKALKFESTVTKSISGYKTFLASLSNTVPMYQAHPNAKKYKLDYKNNKEELCKKLFELYNEKVFDNQLPRDTSIEWNVRMRGTAGYCYNRKSVKSISGAVIKSSRIVLATKILDMPDRLRDTLIHEMCHAAAWIIDGVSDGHGAFWTRWANKAIKVFPELPPIRRCHNYEIKTKFTYKCTGCGYSIGRHSKSLDIEKKRCGYCYGKFELLINKTTKSGTVQVQTPKREPTGFALYVKQNYNSVKKEKNNMRHADVMKLLGQQFSAIKIAKKTDVAS